MSETDWELLSRFVRDHADDAFAAIVRRHVDLVYSTAFRQVRSPQLAEELTQSAFIDLARSAAKLSPDTILTAWLYKVARRTAVDANCSQSHQPASKACSTARPIRDTQSSRHSSMDFMPHQREDRVTGSKSVPGERRGRYWFDGLPANGRGPFRSCRVHPASGAALPGRTPLGRARHHAPVCNLRLSGTTNRNSRFDRHSAKAMGSYPYYLQLDMARVETSQRTLILQGRPSSMAPSFARRTRISYGSED
jgi:RNA polymerase sigma factor (sigma-70 family)